MKKQSVERAKKNLTMVYIIFILYYGAFFFKIKGAMSPFVALLQKAQKTYLYQRKPKNNGSVLYKIILLVL